jgi:hypothetical protein
MANSVPRGTTPPSNKAFNLPEAGVTKPTKPKGPSAATKAAGGRKMTDTLTRKA